MNHKHRNPETELRPIELTSAGILAGLTVALGLSAAAFPIFDIFFRIAAALPIALVSTRFRWQVTLTSCVAAIGVGIAVGGIPTAVSIVQSSLVAWVIGTLYRRQVGKVGTVIAASATSALGAAATLTFLALFRESRILAVDSLRVTLRGWVRGLGYVPGTHSVTQPLNHTIEVLAHYWWLFFPALAAFSVFTAFLISAAALARVMDRLNLREVPDLFTSDPSNETVAPLPMSIEAVTHQYRQDSSPALNNVSFRIDPGEFIIIAGHNGSGKSTLASIIAGIPPTRGRVHCPGALGRGRPGGLAYLPQSATAHIVGNTVREDVAWGFNAHSEDELSNLNRRIEAILDRVGLSHLADAQTQHLSGGELQRLTLASALIHHPALIISDETTAMIDPAGRHQMMQILRDLAADGVAVVHITHDATEAPYATRLIRLSQGKIIFDGSPSSYAQTLGPVDEVDSQHDATASPASATFAGTGEALTAPPLTPLLPAEKQAGVSSTEKRSLWLRSVTHNVAHRTPWQRTILNGVSLVIEAGDCVLITGENGSGKTTLARLLAGLMTPTFGSVLLAGRDMWSKVGDVSLSHQFSRLQLLRATVGEDILDAIGQRACARSREHTPEGLPIFTSEETATITDALAIVGLEEELLTRGIDELSGGQQRRVALAGLIAAEPAALILDEPFAGLDMESRHILVNVLAKVRAQGTSLILISHDDDGLHSLADRHYHLENGRLRGHEVETGKPRRRGIRKEPFVFPRPLPWSSVMTRMWAGTKILTWAAVSTALLFIPSWTTLALCTAYLLALTLGARVPFTAIPRIPFPLLAGFCGGMLGAALGDGVFIFLRATAVMLVILWGTLLLLWTTHTWQLTSAIATLMRPAAWLRLPADSWVHAMALTVKSVPMLLDHMRALHDTMTIRLYRQQKVSNRRFYADMVDVLTASLSAATRHASIIGVAISMRGGIPTPNRMPVQWSWVDSLLSIAAMTTCATIVALSLIW